MECLALDGYVQWERGAIEDDTHVLILDIPLRCSSIIPSLVGHVDYGMHQSLLPLSTMGCCLGDVCVELGRCLLWDGIWVHTLF